MLFQSRPVKVVGEIQSYPKLSISLALRQNRDQIQFWIDFSLMSLSKDKDPDHHTSFISSNISFQKIYFSGQNIYTLLVKLLLRWIPPSYFSSLMCWDNKLGSAWSSAHQVHLWCWGKLLIKWGKWKDKIGQWKFCRFLWNWET